MIVLDASALGAVLLPDENDPLKERVGTVLLDGAIAPPHFLIEVASLLLRAFRRGRVSPADRSAMMTTARTLLKGVAIAPEPPIQSVMYLAEQHGLSAYDASYLWLAIEEGAPLLTTDGPLYRVARKLGVSA